MIGTIISSKLTPPKLINQGRKFPFITVSPQATNGWKPDQLMGMINDLKKKYRIDNDRVYLTGLSMGGFGTWALAAEFPDQFAAIAPICGGGDSTKAWRLRNMPVWCFHGAKDNVVPLIASQEMMSALGPFDSEKKFTVYPEAEHDSWTATYNNDSLYDWLLSKKKFRFEELKAGSPADAKYTGKFLSPRNDTLAVFTRNDSLFLSLRDRRNQVVHLKEARPGIFYFRAQDSDEIRFHTDHKKQIDGFTYLGRQQKQWMRKLTTGAGTSKKTNKKN